MSKISMGKKPTREITVALFGDVHGRLRLMLSLCQRWQLAHKKHLDAVLLCGDLGLFYKKSALDRATQRYAGKDPEELGFARFFGLPKPVERDPGVEAALLGPPKDLRTITAPIIFCHGNHEDHDALRRLAVRQTLVPVDYYNRIFYLRSGSSVNIGNLRIVALGGAPEIQTVDDGQLIGQYVTSEALRQVLSQPAVHVLLTHSPPAPPGVRPPAGSNLVYYAIKHTQPFYHFYGHVRNGLPPQTFGRCKSYWLDHVAFQQTGREPYPIARRCMGILTWRSEEDHHYAYVDEPWFTAVNSQDWSPIRGE